MSQIDLKLKYGKNLKTHEAINRAIRAEIAGGASALDAAGFLRKLRNRLRELDLPEARDVAAAENLIGEVIQAFSDEIARRYGMTLRDPG